MYFKFLLSIFLVAGLVINLPTAQAQKKIAKTTSKKDKASMLKVMDGNKLRRAMPTSSNSSVAGSRAAATKMSAQFADVATNEDKQMATVNYFRTNFPAANATSNQLVYIELFDNKEKKVGELRFYASTASELKGQAKIDNDVLVLNYGIDMLEHIANFLKNNRQTVLIFDDKQKTAHLTAGMKAGK